MSTALVLLSLDYRQHLCMRSSLCKCTVYCQCNSPKLLLMWLLPLAKSVWEGVLGGGDSLHVADAQDDDAPNQQNFKYRNA